MLYPSARVRSEHHPTRYLWRRWRVILRIDGKSKQLGCFSLLWNAVICANYHIAYLGLNVPLNDIAELSKTHPVLIAEKARKQGFGKSTRHGASGGSVLATGVPGH
jgi:hypothetical protein